MSNKIAFQKTTHLNIPVVLQIPKINMLYEQEKLKYFYGTIKRNII